MKENNLLTVLYNIYTKHEIFNILKAEQPNTIPLIVED